MNVIYPKWKEAVIQHAPNSSLAGTVNAYLVDTSLYTYSAAHQFLSALPAAARVGASVTLAAKTFINGVLDAADLTFPLVVGPTVEAMILAIWTGTDATSRLVAYMDQAINLPFTPIGLDQPIAFDPLGIFAI